MMATKYPSKNSCSECSRRVSKTTGILCSLCCHPIHPKCTKLSKQEINNITKNPNTHNYICNICQSFKCGKCNKAVHNSDNALQCEGECSTWFHLKCTRVSLNQYKEFNKNNSKSPSWFCPDCLCSPFSSIDDTQLKKLFFENHLEKFTKKTLKSNNFDPMCSICDRKIHSDKVHKALPCFCCLSLVHRKCSGLSNHVLLNTEASQMIHWECKKCRDENFSFNDIPDEELFSMTFNSNFNCPCLTDCNIEQMRKDLILNLTKFKDNCTDGLDPDCNIDQTFDIKTNFDYYNVHQFHKLSTKISQKKSPPLSIYHTNIQSLNAKFDNLHTHLANLNYPFDVIALTETWNPKHKKDEFSPGKLEGYRKYNGIEGNSLKSGCGLRDSLKTIDRYDLNISYFDDQNEFQCKWIEIVIPKASNILVGVYYRHPKKESNDVFNKHLADTLKKIKPENKEVFIAGDFNYDLLKFTNVAQIDDFISTMFLHFLQPCILEPTRIVDGNKPSLVDNIFTNAISKNIISGNLLNKLSDHMPNFIFVLKISTPQHKEDRKFRDTKNLDETKYKADLSKINILASVANSVDINEVFNDYHNQLMNVVEHHAPYKFRSRKEMKWKQKPWITKGIQNSIKQKNIYYGKYVRTKNTFWYRSYKHHMNAVKRLTFASKIKYYENYFIFHAQNSKKIWQGINEILRKNSKMPNEDIFLNEDGLLLTDQKQVANRFNRFFTNVADNLLEKIGDTNSKYQDYLKNPNEHSMFMNEVDFGEVELIIKNLDTTKSGDIYGLSPKLLQIGATEVSNNLKTIFNLSLKFGQFPDKLKYAKIIPIHKGDSKQTPGNYRPISLLPIIGKVFEKIVYNRVYSFVTDKNILVKNQYGFQRLKSTEHAGLDLQSKIINAYENKLNSCSIFLDFAKAFDTVNHEILLSKLYHYGIRGPTHNWFKSYLSNRQQCVQVNNHLSDFATVKHGVPQGSILGPLLFLLYINDITQSTKNLEFLLFADDTSIFLAKKDLKTLEDTINTELDHVSNWLKANKLSLNVKKSNVLLFRGRNAKKMDQFNIKIDGNPIEEKEFAKYLGLYFDNKLTFKPQIDHVLTKLKKGNGILAKLRHFVPNEKVRSVYFAHIESHLNYGSIIWGGAAKYHLDKIILAQKKGIKIMNFIKTRDHIELPFKNNKVLPVDRLRALSMCKFIWKIYQGITPFASSLLDQNQVVVNERDNTKYLVPYKNTLHARTSIFYSGILNWNKIPTDIKNSASLPNFTSKCKEFFLDKLNS